MAVIWGLPHNRRAKKFKNFIRIQRMKGGGYQAASWPKKGQRDKSPAGYERARLFGAIQHWTSRPLFWEQLDALELSVGTPYLPRDILTKFAYGKITEIRFKDGRRVWPEKLMASEVQGLLDAITTQPGSLLVRTASEWVGLEPGPAGNALVSNGPASLPSYKSVGGGGSGGGWSLPLFTPNTSTSSPQLKGNWVRLFESATITAIAGVFGADGEITMAPFIAEIESNEISAVTALEPEITFTASDKQTLVAELTEPVALKKDTDYMIGWQFISRNPTGPFSFYLASAPATYGPFVSGFKCYTATDPVEVGTAVTLFDNTCFALPLNIG